MGQSQILLVDDNPDDVALARRALARSEVGAQLEVASSGLEALDRLTNSGELPKAVFLDLNMPELSGFEVLSRLRQEPSTRNLPIVVLTTSREPFDIRRSYALGANSFVTKPLNFSEFTDVFVRMSHYWMNDNQAPPE